MKTTAYPAAGLLSLPPTFYTLQIIRHRDYFLQYHITLFTSDIARSYLTPVRIKEGDNYYTAHLKKQSRRDDSVLLMMMMVVVPMLCYLAAGHRQGLLQELTRLIHGCNG